VFFFFFFEKSFALTIDNQQQLRFFTTAKTETN